MTLSPLLVSTADRYCCCDKHRRVVAVFEQLVTLSMDGRAVMSDSTDASSQRALDDVTKGADTLNISSAAVARLMMQQTRNER